MTPISTVQRAHLAARFDASQAASLDSLEPLVYARTVEGLPTYVRAASALRRFQNRLVIVQDDTLALGVRDDGGGVEPVLLPAHASGRRVFDDTLGNKHEKLDLEACVTLPSGVLVAFGSGSLVARERIVLWNGAEPPALAEAQAFYGELRAAVTHGASRLNIEGAVVRGERLELFHRGNDARGAGGSAIVEIACEEFARWLERRAKVPRVARVTTVDLGFANAVPFGFTDAVALDDERVVILACAEETPDALADGVVLGCRVGMLDSAGLRTVDVYDATGRTLLKLEGIERRAGSSTQFDVCVDVDRPAVAAQLGRLVWEWH